MLGSFNTAKCVQHCIGKYIQGSGIEDSLTQTKVLGVKVLKSVLDGTNYARALKVILILSNAITRLKWQAFLKTKDVVQVNEYAVLLSDLQQALSAKDPDRSKRAYRDCMTSILMLKKDFDEFSKTCAEKSEMCRYWDGLIKLSKTLTSLIAANRDGNWAFSIFFPFGSFSLYFVFLEASTTSGTDPGTLRKCENFQRSILRFTKNYLDGKFVVKTKQLIAYFQSGLQEYMSFRNARFVTKEMKLSDTIKRKNLPSFRAKGKAASLEGSSLQTKKATSKKLWKMQKEIDMAK